MDSVQEQEAKKQKLEQVEDIVQEEEEDTDEYTEQDLKLGHELIAAVIANDLVKLNTS